MPERDPTGTDRLAAYMRAKAAEKAARDEALHVVERWNAALAKGRGALWSPTIRCAVTAGTTWLDVCCLGWRTSRAIDIRTVDHHPLASVGKPGTRLALFAVPGLCADACAQRVAQNAAGGEVE